MFTKYGCFILSIKVKISSISSTTAVILAIEFAHDIVQRWKSSKQTKLKIVFPRSRWIMFAVFFFILPYMYLIRNKNKITLYSNLGHIFYRCTNLLFMYFKPLP